MSPVVAHAQLAKPERAQQLLAAFHHAQVLAGDLGPVGNPRGQAGRGRLVVAREPEVRRPPPARRAFVKPSSASGERTPASAAARRPGPPVGEVVGDRPVEDRRGADALGHGSQLPIQLALAVVAAVDGIGSEVGVRQLAGGHDLDRAPNAAA